MNILLKKRGRDRERERVDQYGREKSVIIRFIDKYGGTLLKWLKIYIGILLNVREKPVIVRMIEKYRDALMLNWHSYSRGIAGVLYNEMYNLNKLLRKENIKQISPASWLWSGGLFSPGAVTPTTLGLYHSREITPGEGSFKVISALMIRATSCVKNWVKAPPRGANKILNVLKYMEIWRNNIIISRPLSELMINSFKMCYENE